MPNVIITGAGSGLGHAFVQEFSKDTATRIFALDRLFPLDWLSTISNQGNISTTTLDITDESSLLHFASSLPEDVKQAGIQIVVHSAGIRGLVAPDLIRDSSSVATAETYSVMDVSTLQSTFTVNAIGTFLLIRALLPYLSSTPDSKMTRPDLKSKVIIMGSRMGSIESNVAGGGYAYRASKAALNAIVKSFALDFKDVRFLVVHPGRVETGLVGVREDGAFTVREVMPELMGLIERTGQDGDLYVDRLGKRIPW